MPVTSCLFFETLTNPSALLGISRTLLTTPSVETPLDLNIVLHQDLQFKTCKFPCSYRSLQHTDFRAVMSCFSKIPWGNKRRQYGPLQLDDAKQTVSGGDRPVLDVRDLYSEHMKAPKANCRRIKTFSIIFNPAYFLLTG